MDAVDDVCAHVHPEPCVDLGESRGWDGVQFETAHLALEEIHVAFHHRVAHVAVPAQLAHERGRPLHRVEHAGQQTVHDVLVRHHRGRHFQVRHSRDGQVGRVVVVSHLELEHEADDTVDADRSLIRVAQLVLHRRELLHEWPAFFKSAAVLLHVEGLDNRCKGWHQCHRKQRRQVYRGHAIAGESLPQQRVWHHQCVALGVEPLLLRQTGRMSVMRSWRTLNRCLTSATKPWLKFCNKISCHNPKHTTPQNRGDGEL